MEKSYVTSVIEDTPSLGKITFRAWKMVNTILSLPNAEVSTLHSVFDFLLSGFH